MHLTRDNARYASGFVGSIGGLLPSLFPFSVLAGFSPCLFTQITVNFLVTDFNDFFSPCSILAQGQAREHIQGTYPSVLLSYPVYCCS